MAGPDGPVDAATYEQEGIGQRPGTFGSLSYSRMEEAEADNAGGTVSRNYRALVNAIDDLQKSVAVHVERIDAVLVPDPSEGQKMPGGGEDVDVRRGSDLAGLLEDMAARVRTINSKMGSATARVDL